tara:strand:- start:30 stop:344 length:315 start_codon:yes stop_codon:yes gene_type:complete
MTTIQHLFTTEHQTDFSHFAMCLNRDEWTDSHGNTHQPHMTHISAVESIEVDGLYQHTFTVEVGEGKFPHHTTEAYSFVDENGGIVEEIEYSTRKSYQSFSEVS